MLESIFCRSLSCICCLADAPDAPAVVDVVPVVVDDVVVVVFCDGRAAAVTGRGWVGVSAVPLVAVLLVPGDDCTLNGLNFYSST